MDSTTGGGLFDSVGFFIALAYVALLLIAGWKMYVKAGQHGWTSIIPVINILAMLKIVHRPVWWILLMLIPIVNFFVWIVLLLDLAKSFGKGIGMALLLVFFAPIGYLILGFGGAQYQLEKDPLFG